MALPHFTPRQIDAFVAAAELSNFSLAARRLNLTPSAVSGLIGDLEGALGFALFERTTRRVALTAEGREFLPSAIAVQIQLSRAALAAVDISNRAVDVVRIAAPMAVAATVLPPLIAEFRQRHSKTQVRIIDTAVEWLGDRVLIGEADLALGPDRAVPTEIARTDLFPTSWVLWCKPDNPLAQLGAEVRWRELRTASVVAAGRDHEHSIRPLLPPGSQAAAIQPVQIVENISTALGIAAAGLGVTFSPDYVAPFAKALGLVKRVLIEPEITRYMSLYEPCDRTLSDAASVFRQFLAGNARPPRDEQTSTR